MNPLGRTDRAWNVVDYDDTALAISDTYIDQLSARNQNFQPFPMATVLANFALLGTLKPETPVKLMVGAGNILRIDDRNLPYLRRFISSDGNEKTLDTIALTYASFCSAVDEVLGTRPLDTARSLAVEEGFSLIPDALDGLKAHAEHYRVTWEKEEAAIKMDGFYSCWLEAYPEREADYNHLLVQLLTPECTSRVPSPIPLLSIPFPPTLSIDDLQVSGDDLFRESPSSEGVATTADQSTGTS